MSHSKGRKQPESADSDSATMKDKLLRELTQIDGRLDGVRTADKRLSRPATQPTDWKEVFLQQLRKDK